MSEYQRQKKEKPSVLTMAEQLLESTIKEDLLSFVSFLKEQQMSPQWASTNSYSVSFRNRRVCIIKLAPNSFQLWLNTQYNDDFNACFAQANEADKAFLLANVITCFGCGTCKPGLNIHILGTPFYNACYNPVIRIINPNEEQLSLARQLVLLRRQAIRDGKAPKVTYLAMSKR